MVSAWGSAALFEIDSAAAAKEGGEKEGKVDVTIPLHLRYLTPTAGGYSNTSIPYPVVFWACSANSPGPSFGPAGNPFDRTILGYDQLFGEGTVFHHFEPSAATGAAENSGGEVVGVRVGEGEGRGELVMSVRVPVLDLSRGWYVEGLTASVVVMGVLWLVWKFVKPIPKTNTKKVRKA